MQMDIGRVDWVNCARRSRRKMLAVLGPTVFSFLACSAACRAQADGPLPLPAPNPPSVTVSPAQYGDPAGGDDPYSPRFDAPSTHRAISLVAAKTHPGTATMRTFLEQDLLISGHVNAGVLGRSFADWIAQGSIDQDGGCFGWVDCRVVHHFYNPVDNSGLSVGLTIGNSSLLWAWDKRTYGLSNAFNWKNGRTAYYNWMAGTTRAERDEAGRDMFLCLGQVIHLVQDLAQPQHTRNDIHPPSSPSRLEALCAQEFGNEGAIAGLPPESIPQFTIPYTNTSAPSRIPRAFASFWDTDQYTRGDPGRPFAGTLGLAEYSHFYFISTDTMFESNDDTVIYDASNGRWQIELDPDPTFFNHGRPIGSSLFPRLENTNIVEALGSVQRADLNRWGDAIPAPTPTRGSSTLRYNWNGESIDNYCVVTWDGVRPNGDRNFDGIGITNDNYRAHARKLLPKAVAYSAGVLKYFFRAKFTETQSWNGTANQIAIRNTSDEPFGRGTWTLLYEDAAGNRRPVPGFNSQYQNSLPVGQSFNITYPDGDLCLPLGTLTLVFRGDIGDASRGDLEADSVVAKRFAPRPAAFSGTCGPFPNVCGCGSAGTTAARIEIDRSPSTHIESRFIVNGLTYSSPLQSCAGNSMAVGLGGDGFQWRGTVLGTQFSGQVAAYYCPSNPPPRCIMWGVFMLNRTN